MSLEKLYEAVLNGNAQAAAAETQAALDAGVPAEEVLFKGCIPAMEEVGRLFEEGEKFVPEMLISARAMSRSYGTAAPDPGRGRRRDHRHSGDRHGSR